MQSSKVVALDSQDLGNYIQSLKWLKHGVQACPALDKLKPRICLSCWVIFSRDTELFHSDLSAHKTTNEFHLMNEADAKVYVKLAKANG